MKRLTGFAIGLAAFFATPAAAEAPVFLKPLEQRLFSIANANPGNIGVAALDLKTGQLVSVYGDDAFPMASTVKVAIAANYMSQVEAGRRSLDATIGGQPVRSLMARMLIHSDNVATDMILNNLGGPAPVQAWIDQHGITGLRIDRTIASLLAAKRDLKDVRDSATPKAMVTMLQKLDSGAMLRPSSRDYILDLMAQCATGKNRIPGLLSGVKVQHKTGTLTGLTTDVGYLTLPDGRRVAIAVFARYGANRPATIATAARAVYDGFVNFVTSPFRVVPSTTAAAVVGASH
ncbi:serine hydrolase [Sphingomonas jaspsi]|uniref:serine hydrolase n=1 Tax=Sphingomonas jaspsi TaxID=392409 RepID=UPI0004B917AD|nr:serine hydrolase [Sphingomonas jaspsi]